MALRLMKSFLSRGVNCIKRRFGDLSALSQNSVCLVKMVNLDRAAASGTAPVKRVKQTTILAKMNLGRPWNLRSGIPNLFAGEINFDKLWGSLEITCPPGGCCSLT